jgi:DHHC palmitoyltransferase
VCVCVCGFSAPLYVDWLLSPTYGYVVAVVAVLYYGVIGALFVWSWLRTMLTDPGAVPASFTDSRTRCRRCSGLKPPRAHHCSMVDRCVLRFDHYCPWVFQTVGHYNYKFYFLTVLYCTLLCGTVSLAVLARFLVTGVRFSDECTLELSLCGTLLAVALLFWFMVGGLFGTHYRYVALNLTTVEWMSELNQFQNLGVRGFDRFRLTDHRWYLGTERRNWEQVLGTRPLLWFLPVATTLGDGICFAELLPLGSGSSGSGAAFGEGEEGHADEGEREGKSARPPPEQCQDDISIDLGP